MLTLLSRQVLKLTPTIHRIETAAYSSLTANRKEHRRFYQNVTIEQSDTNTYHICLDKSKLKTPSGQIFQVGDKTLANMIAFEWQSQTDTIKRHSMHLTSLINTCMDNPGKLTKENLITSLIEYLQTDTLLYFDSYSIEKLDRAQETKWRPLVDWFNLKFTDMNLKISYGLDVPNEIDPNKLNSFKHYLNNNFSLTSLIAFNYMSECLKSVVLTTALLERFIPTAEDACKIAGLEQEHQYDQWGKVEWYHDVNEEELKARVSAALLFIYLSHDSKYYLIKN